jgi:hypothetical protein
MPKTYVLIAEVFHLPKDADTEAIVKSMTAGLEFTLSQYPVLLGALEMNSASGRMWVSKPRNAIAALKFKHMLHEDEFLSYTELSQKDVSFTIKISALLNGIASCKHNRGAQVTS